MDKIEEQLQRVAVASLMLVRSNTPYRSGTLSRNWQLRMMPNGFEIVNSTSYLPYVNEKWVSPRWRGRDNYNEGFVKNATDLVAEFVASQLGGVYVSNG